MSSTATNNPHRSLLGYVLCVAFGATVSLSAVWLFVVEPGNRAIAAGLATASELKSANAKLASDLASAQSSASDLARRLADRQRVINEIDQSVEPLGSGLADGIATIDQVIVSIQNIIGILQHG